jgi:hypothetical protein
MDWKRLVQIGLLGNRLVFRSFSNSVSWPLPQPLE